MNPDIASIPLRDIHLPESVSWWPLAPGWWITVGLFLLAAVVVYFLKFIKERRQLEKQSLEEFARIVDQYQKDHNISALLENVSQLLRRISITQYDRDNIAGLTGEAWLKFLDETMSGGKGEQALRFRGELGSLLITGQYQKKHSISEQKLDQLLILSKAWLLTVTRQRARRKPDLHHTLLRSES